MQRAVRAGIVEANHLVDKDGSFGPSGVGDALLHHIRRKFVLRELQYFTSDCRHDPRLIFRFPVLCKKKKKKEKNPQLRLVQRPNDKPRMTPTQNVLDNIVAILILDQRFRVLMQFVQYWRCLFRSAVFQNALNDATPVRVRGQ